VNILLNKQKLISATMQVFRSRPDLGMPLFAWRPDDVDAMVSMFREAGFSAELVFETIVTGEPRLPELKAVFLADPSQLPNYLQALEKVVSEADLPE
jgi:hypothetical protein